MVGLEQGSFIHTHVPRRFALPPSSQAVIRESSLAVVNLRGGGIQRIRLFAAVDHKLVGRMLMQGWMWVLLSIIFLIGALAYVFYFTNWLVPPRVKAIARVARAEISDYLKQHHPDIKVLRENRGYLIVRICDTDHTWDISDVYSEILLKEMTEPDAVVSSRNFNVRQKLYAEAVKRLRDTFKFFRTPLVNKAMAHLDNGNVDEALRGFDAAVERNPNDLIAVFNRGQLYMAEGEWQNALADFSRAIELEPTLAEAFCNRGGMYERLEEPEKALDDYNTAISLDPKLASAYCNRASYYESVGRHDDSIADCTRALEEAPQIMNAFLNRGTSYSALERWQEAIADFDQALKIQPLAVTLRRRAQAFNAVGQYQKAVDDSTNAINMHPQVAQFYLVRAEAYRGLNETKAAEDDEAKAAKLS